MDTQVQWDQEDMMQSQVLMEYQDTMELREREDIWVSANTEMINQNTYATVNHFHVPVFFAEVFIVILRITNIRLLHSSLHSGVHK